MSFGSLTFRTRSANGNAPTVIISQMEMTIYPRRNNCISLLPTAACFRSDLHRRKTVTRIASTQIKIDPKKLALNSSLDISSHTQITQMPSMTQRDTSESATSKFLIRRLIVHHKELVAVSYVDLNNGVCATYITDRKRRIATKVLLIISKATSTHRNTPHLHESCQTE